MPAALAVAVGVSAVSSVVGGISAQKAANAEAKLQQEQGRIAYEESQVNAENEAYNQRKFVGKQRLAFLANGVTLEGSPTLVLEETRRYGQQQVDSILRQGASTYNLAQRQAANTKNAGRAALISGVMQGITTAASGYSMLKKAPQAEGVLG